METLRRLVEPEADRTPAPPPLKSYEKVDRTEGEEEKLRLFCLPDAVSRSSHWGRPGGGGADGMGDDSDSDNGGGEFIDASARAALDA